MSSRIFLSVPWCCVFTLGITLFSVGGASSAYIKTIDQITHALIPVSIVAHIFVGVHLYRSRSKKNNHSHKKSEHILFLVSVTVLISVVFFHLSSLHEYLFKHAH